MFLFCSVYKISKAPKYESGSNTLNINIRKPSVKTMVTIKFMFIILIFLIIFLIFLRAQTVLTIMFKLNLMKSNNQWKKQF